MKKYFWLINMVKNPKSYTPEFKQQIVDLYNAGGTSYPQPEREYGVNRCRLINWAKQLAPMKVSEENYLSMNVVHRFHFPGLVIPNRAVYTCRSQKYSDYSTWFFICTDKSRKF